MSKTISHATLWVVTFFMVAVLCLFGISKAGDVIESKVFPLYDEVSLTYIVRNDETADVLLAGHKLRNCVYRGVNVEVFRNGKWRRANSVTLDRQGEELLISEQQIAVGSSVVRFLRITPPGEKIKVRLEATCHSFWPSYQDLPVITAQASQDNSGVAQR